jgi:hypothetical protein
MREPRPGVNYDAGTMLMKMRPTVRMVVRYVERTRGVHIPKVGSLTVRAGEAIHALQEQSQGCGMLRWFGISRMVEILTQFRDVSKVVRLMETLHNSKWKGVL